MTKFIYSFAIGISLLLIPVSANADEVLIELTPETAYVDIVVEVTEPTIYVIETFTGPRFEQAPNGSTVERVAWVDSWIQLRQGDTVLRQDDDGNHSNANFWASRLSGNATPGTYTIRATSYDYVVANQRPIGTYTLNSNLIQTPPPPLVVEPEPEPIVPPEPAVEPPVAPPEQSEPLEPIIIPQEPPIEPPAVIEEPPAIIEEPTTPVEEAPVEAEEPPVEAEQPPVEEEAPPTPVEEAPPTVEEAVADIIAEADGEAITVEDMEEAGLTYEDLPPDTPVEVRTDANGNEVVVTAEVAAALQVFESPAELLSAIFNDPGQVLTAVANIGADMSDEERKESEEIIVASVIASQAAINAAGMAAGTATRIPSSPSTPAGGPAAGNDKPRSTRRRKP